MKPSVSLRAKSLDQFAGILAFVWTAGGYGLFRAGAAGYPGAFDSPQSALLITLVWFGVSLLLVIAGLRRGSIVGRVCSLATVGMLLWLTDPFHGMVREVENLFRKTEYAQVYYGAPE